MPEPTSTPRRPAPRTPAPQTSTAQTSAAQTSAAQTSAAQTSAAQTSAARGSAPAAPAQRDPRQSLAPDAQDWSPAELDEQRAQLLEQAESLRAEIVEAQSTAEAVQRSTSGQGSGDEADAGTKTFEREHEQSLANNGRGMLLQVQRALERLDAGTYGRCEGCGQQIAKARLQAFPRGTLCVACKQREERR